MDAQPERQTGRRFGAILAIALLVAACGSGTASTGPTASSGPTASPAQTAAAIPTLSPTTVASATAGTTEPPATASTEPPPTPSSAAPSPAPSASATAQPSTCCPPPVADNVRLALDWTPNTNHTGFYVSSAKGWYAEAGIHLDILPYNQTAPEAFVDAGHAECGISFQDSLTFAVAAGAKLTSVMAILQHTASAIAVLADGPIKRPKDLDGTTYGGFGYPADHPTIQVVIKHDGGKGVFREVTLNASAYEALFAKQVDSTIVFTAWEGIEAKERKIDLRYFKPTDYGFPDSYQVVLACNSDWLARAPDVARRFVEATVRGFEYAATNPADAAAILISSNPGVFDANPALPQESAQYLADQKLYLNDAGLVGPQTLEQWAGYSGFLYREGLLTDANGKPLSAPPDYGSLFTNDLLPGGP